MSLQGLLSGANPLLVLAAALVYFLVLYLRRGGGNDHAEYQAAPQQRANHHSHDVQTTNDVRSPDVAVDTGTAVGRTTDASITAAGADYELTDDTLRRHARYDRGYGEGASGGAAVQGAHTTSHSASTHTTSVGGHGGLSHEPAGRTPHVPAEYSYSEGGGGSSWKWPVVAALCASLVSCQIASKDGIAGIPGNIASLFGSSRPAIPAVAKIEAAVVAPAELKAKANEVKAEVKAKATEAVATVKAKVAEVAEKAVEAAKPEVKPVPVAAPVAKPEAVAEEKPAPAPVPEAPAAKGATSYYGFAEKPDGQQLWAAPATVYSDVKVPAPQVVEAAPAPVTPAAPEAAPVSLGGVGQTSYFGIAEKPDATFAWAAPATVYIEAAPAEPAPAAAPAPVAAAPEPAPVSLGGVGQTSYYGIAEKPDATFPWAAPATLYKVAAPAPAPAPAPVTPAAIENCRDALNAEAQAGKINFATSSWDILPESYKTLDKLARLAKDCGGVVIEVGGHTDSTGKAASNKTLSELRAKAVAKYLAGAGVDAGKLRAVGYGQDRPVASNDTDAGKRQNRRIEFLVTAP